jgi:predicted 3-demethylubiquinone-9 3-methyltransferase (glyoxalase superfamily)
MAIAIPKILPCLWFDGHAEEAARFYVSVFKDAKLGEITRYGKEGYEIHGREAGSVMTVTFELEGQKLVVLNGGPHFRFNEAVSFQIHCDTQDEIDYFWSRLTEGGSEGLCGWLKDKFGLSWQIVPKVLIAMLTDPDTAKSQRVTTAFLQMTKFDIAALERAYAG